MPNRLIIGISCIRAFFPRNAGFLHNINIKEVRHSVKHKMNFIVWYYLYYRRNIYSKGTENKIMLAKLGCLQRVFMQYSYNPSQ